MKIYFCEFIMWQRVAFAMTVVPLAIGGGVLAPFVCGMHAEQGATVGFCLVSALAIVQAFMVASGIAKARKLHSNVRKRMLSRNSSEISRRLRRWAMRVRDRPSHSIDRSKLWSSSSIRHCHVRWYGAFHRRSIDSAACPHSADQGVMDTHGVSLLHRDEEDH
jgi:hypothetical protein